MTENLPDVKPGYYRVPEQQAADLPGYFRVARAFAALLRGGRGEFLVYRLLQRAGLLKRLGRFRFFDGYLYIPLDYLDTLYLWDFTMHEGLREVNFANVVIRHLRSQATLVDCGAAFGQVSCRLAHLCPNLARVVAFEPNPASYQVLSENLRLLEGRHAEAIQAAVADFNGRGRLVFPHGEGDPHAAFIRQHEKGDIRVDRLDRLDIEPGSDLALKLDVEGGEFAAVAGAAGLLRSAGRCCCFVEIHPEVLRRNGATAEGLLRAIDEIRQMRWTLAHAPLSGIDPARPFYDQVEPGIYDVIGVSVD